jgi:hypothetical protein
VLAVTTTPVGARLFVDDRFAGETPTDVELIDGTHALRLSLRGYEDALRTIEAIAGQRDTWSVELVAVPEQAPQWYEDPIVWIVAGASVVAITVLAVVIAVVAQPSASQLDQFCMPEGRCIRFDPTFM